MLMVGVLLVDPVVGGGWWEREKWSALCHALLLFVQCVYAETPTTPRKNCGAFHTRTDYLSLGILARGCQRTISRWGSRVFGQASLCRPHKPPHRAWTAINKVVMRCMKSWSICLRRWREKVNPDGNEQKKHTDVLRSFLHALRRGAKLLTALLP